MIRFGVGLLVAFLSCTIPGQVAGQSCDRNGRYFDEVFGVSRTADVIYGGNFRFDGNFEDLELDVYSPDGDVATDRALVVLAHQGGFLFGDKFAGEAAMGRLAARLASIGYVAASINYRQGFPNLLNVTERDAESALYRATQDMRAAVRFFRRDVVERENTYGIDPDAIIVGGSSAGAIMALHTAYMDEDDEVAQYIDTTGLGPLAGSSGNPGYSSDVAAVINLSGAILDTLFIKPGDKPLVSAHSLEDMVVPYFTGEIALSDSVFKAFGSHTIHERVNALGIPDSLHTFLGGAPHIPFSPNTALGQAYLDTVFTVVRDFLFDEITCKRAVGVQNASLSQDEISISPNPSNGRFVVDFVRPTARRTTLAVYNMTGRLVTSLSVPAGAARQTIQLDAPSGVYVVRIGKARRLHAVIR